MSRTARVAGGPLAAAVLAVVLAACGGDPQPGAKAAPGGHEPAKSGVPGVGGGAPASGPAGTPAGGGSTTRGGAGSGTSEASPATGTGGVPGATGSPAPGGTPSPSTKPSPTQIVLNATLAKACVRPGDTQTLTLKARPHMNVIVNTGYADQKEGSTYGGRFTRDQRTDATGLYTVSWTVALTAPHGDAATSVAAVDSTGSGHRRIPFRVAASC